MPTNTLAKDDNGTIGSAFQPRRLGHTNVQVSDLEQSIAFYNGVIGFDVVYRKVSAGGKVVGGFFSNGNTYHDLACFEHDVAGVLNHPAFECSTEADLLAGYRRAVETGTEFRTSDYVVARSLYTRDPDGGRVEIYSDTTPDWRQLRGDGRTVGHDSRPWTPGDPGHYTPHVAHNYPVDPELVRLDHSAFQAKRMRYAAIATHDLARMLAFYEQFVGLHVLDSGTDYVVLGGTTEQPSLALYEVADTAPTGMHHMGCEVWSLEAGLARLAERDAPPPAFKIDDTLVVISDPDGIVLSLFEDSQVDTAGVSEIARKLLDWSPPTSEQSGQLSRSSKGVCDVDG